MNADLDRALAEAKVALRELQEKLTYAPLTESEKREINEQCVCARRQLNLLRRRSNAYRAQVRELDRESPKP